MKKQLELLGLSIALVIIFQAIAYLIALVAGFAGIHASSNLIFSILVAAFIFVYGRS